MDAQLQGQEGYGYLRISDDKEGKALGVGRQREDIQKLADYLGVRIVRWFTDNSISASTNTDEWRADYEEMMKLVEAGPVRLILSYTTSRLTRKPEETEHQIKLARKHGVQYYYVRGQALDLQVAANRRMARYQAANDAGEAEELQERVVRKKLANAQEGKWDGGRRTYGYGKPTGYKDKHGKDILDPYQVREDELALLHEGKRRILAGDSQFEVCRSWQHRGLTTALGGTWDVGRLKRTLLNQSYVQFDPTGHPTDCPCLHNPDTGGTRIHHDERHRAKWPYIFTRAEHEAMVAVFNGRDIFWSNTGRLRGRTYLLSGLIECGGMWRDTERQGEYCGGAMYGQGKTHYTKRGKVYQRRYACRKWNSAGLRVGCCSVFRIADPVELFVSEQVLERFSSPEIAQALAPADNEDQMAKVVQELAELQVRREQLAAEYAEGLHDQADYRVMLKTVKAKLDDATARKQRLLGEKARSLAVPTDGGLREIWESASLEWRASVARLIVDKVVVLPGRPGSSKWPDKNGWVFNPDLIQIHWLV